MIKFIYFDLGKVVFDHNRIFAPLAVQFGHTEEEYMNEFMRYKAPLTAGGMAPQQFWDQIRIDLEIKDGTDFDFTGYWIDQYTPRVEVHDSMKDLQRRYKIGLLSNIYKGMWPLLLARGKVPDLSYASLILSCEVGFGKPDQRIYELAEKRAGAGTDEILYIDDKPFNLEVARKRGWNTILFDTINPARTVAGLYSFMQNP